MGGKRERERTFLAITAAILESNGRVFTFLIFCYLPDNFIKTLEPTWGGKEKKKKTKKDQNDIYHGN